MKVMWLCNIMLPVIAESLSLKALPVGGWLSGMSEELLKTEGVDLTICFPVEGKEIIQGQVGSLKYFGFPAEKNTEEYLSVIVKKTDPNLIHIFGTEYKHTFDMVSVCEKCNLINKVVISIQGLVSVCENHFCSGLPWSVVNSKTLFEFLLGRGIRKGRKSFRDKGVFETEAIKKVKYVIGRTEWDYACTKIINPEIKYFFCNETLRSSFYCNRWSYDKCNKHTIFVSQCSYPIKGFHMILEAMKDVVKFYPDVHLYTTGISPFASDLKSRLKMTTYRKYIGKLLKKYNLEDKVTFLGTLSENGMLEQYLKANVFVSASSIENSPNSVGEAMILGTPVVSSDVGGVKDLLQHGTEGYVYPFDEPYMLAHYVCKVFGMNEKAEKLGEMSNAHASETHNRENNLKALLDIYEKIRG